MNMPDRELLIESHMRTDKLRGWLQTAVRVLGDARRCGKLSLQEEDEKGPSEATPSDLSMGKITACHCKFQKARQSTQEIGGA